MSRAVLTERGAIALRALAFYGDWVDHDDVARFARENTSIGNVTGWQNTLASLAARGLADEEAVPGQGLRYRHPGAA